MTLRGMVSSCSQIKTVEKIDQLMCIAKGRRTSEPSQTKDHKKRVSDAKLLLDFYFVTNEEQCRKIRGSRSPSPMEVSEPPQNKVGCFQNSNRLRPRFNDVQGNVGKVVRCHKIIPDALHSHTPVHTPMDINQMGKAALPIRVASDSTIVKNLRRQANPTTNHKQSRPSSTKQFDRLRFIAPREYSQYQQVVDANLPPIVEIKPKATNKMGARHVSYRVSPNIHSNATMRSWTPPTSNKNIPKSWASMQMDTKETASGQKTWVLRSEEYLKYTNHVWF